MKYQAGKIGKDLISYKPTETNSNSVVSSVLNAVGINVANVEPNISGPNVHPGMANTLPHIPITPMGNIGSSRADNIMGAVGNDELVGDSGFDTLWGNSGIDTLFGGEGYDHIYGNQGIDLIFGNSGADQLHGGQDADTLYGGQGDDYLSGDSGNDSLSGDANNDVVNGGGGNDILSGGMGNDTLDGGDGNDSVYGGQGDDVIYISAGEDDIHGDRGNDTFFMSDIKGYFSFKADYQIGDRVQLNNWSVVSTVKNPSFTRLNLTNSVISNTAYLDIPFGQDHITVSGGFVTIF